jgi:hypothetical protein
MEVLYRLSYRGIFRLCGGGRIRTSVGEAGRFTVCSLWPLGHTPGHAPAALCAERPNMVANATDFSTDREGTAGTFDREPGKGFEPPTGRLQGGCSTSELPGRAAAGGAPHAGVARLRKASQGFARLRQLVSTLRPPAFACQHVPALRPPLVSTLRALRPSLVSKSPLRPTGRHALYAPGIVTAQTPRRRRPSAESGARQCVAC